MALVIVAIGASLGNPTGYAISQTRDLGPRVAHVISPIKDRGDPGRAYTWAPVVGPTIGGTPAGLTLDRLDITSMMPPFPP